MPDRPPGNRVKVTENNIGVYAEFAGEVCTAVGTDDDIGFPAEGANDMRRGMLSVCYDKGFFVYHYNAVLLIRDE
jgi:phage major head subunit gpT-like protein